MSEPTVSYPVREVLGNIESNVATLRQDVHAIQLTLAAGSATTVAEKADAAIARARLALWAAAGSPLVAVALTWWIARR